MLAKKCESQYASSSTGRTTLRQQPTPPDSKGPLPGRCTLAAANGMVYSNRCGCLSSTRCSSSKFECPCRDSIPAGSKSRLARLRKGRQPTGRKPWPNGGSSTQLAKFQRVPTTFEIGEAEEDLGLGDSENEGDLPGAPWREPASDRRPPLQKLTRDQLQRGRKLLDAAAATFEIQDDGSRFPDHQTFQLPVEDLAVALLLMG